MAELVRVEPSLFRADEEWLIYDNGRSYLRRTGRADNARSAPAIMSDSIDPIRGPDGRVHTSLSTYRASLRPDGNPQGERYYELGDQSLKHTPLVPDRAKRRDDIRRGLEDVKNNRVPPLTILED